MTENHDSKEPPLQNGGVTHQEEDEGGQKIDYVESKEDMFEDATDDMDSNGTQQDQDYDAPSSSLDEFEGVKTLLDKTVKEKESIANEFKEERERYERELGMLRGELKALANGIGDGGNEEMMVGGASLSAMISECSQLVKAALEERLQTERMIGELNQRIEEFNARAQMDEQNVEVVADRMLGSLGVVVNPGELLDYSVSGKIAYVERSASLLVEHYGWMLYEINQLRQCLTEGGFNFGGQEDCGPASVFAAARGELHEIKRKEAEAVEKLGHLEDENRNLVEQVEKEKVIAEAANADLGRLKVELEQEKNRCANTKEKLSMAVTKGKALIQQRDSLKQSLAEKTNELEKCLAELQEKSSAIEVAELCKSELVKCETLVGSLQEMLTEKNAIVESLEEVFSLTNVPEGLLSMDIIERLKWLVNEFASQQEMLSKKNAAFENFEEIISQTIIPEELESANLLERLRWLVNFAASVQETLSQRDKIVDNLEEVFSQIDVSKELQSMDSVEKLKWLVEERNALKSNLLEFHKLKDALSLIDLPETASSLDLESQIGWLKESVNQAKDEINKLQEEIARTKESAHDDIDGLSVSLSAALQEKEYIKMELDDLAHDYEGIVEKAHLASSEKDQMVQMLLEGSGLITNSLEGYQTFSDLAVLIQRCFGKIKEQNGSSFNTSAVAEVFERMQSLLYVSDQELMLCEKLLEEDMLVRSEVSSLSSELRVASLELARLKEENEALRKDLKQSEEKSTLLREKLSLAVKKGKGLVQDRENMKLLMDEKNSEIENLKVELQKQESMVAECKDEINRLSKLEADLVAARDQGEQLEQFLSQSNSMLRRVIESIDYIDLPVDSAFEEPIQKVDRLVGYLNECQQAKTHAEQELGTVKEEISTLASELAEARQATKSVQDALSIAVKRISKLSEDKEEMEVAQRTVEQDLQKAIDETTAQTSKFMEACAAIKSLEEDLSLAENNISVLTKEKEVAQLSRVSMEAELEKVREDVDMQASKLTEAFRTIKSLEDALTQAETNVSLLSEQNNHVQDGRTNVENEIKKLKEEAESHSHKMVDALSTIKSLEDALSKASNDISVLEDEKRIAEQEICVLNSKLKACMDELAGMNGSLQSRSVELIHCLGDLQMLMKNESLLSMIRQHFEKQFASLKNMDIIVKDIRAHFVHTDSEAQNSYLFMEDDSHAMKPFPYDHGNMMNDEINGGDFSIADVDNISLYFKKTLEVFQLRNKNLGDNFEVFFIFIDEFIEALSRKLRATKDAVVVIFQYMESMKEKMKNMEILKEEHENSIARFEQDHSVLYSACTSATRELQFEVKNNLLKLSSIPELEKLNHCLISDVSEVCADDTGHEQRLDDSTCTKTAEKLLSATSRVQTLTKLLESTGNAAAATIEDLQNKLRETREAFEISIEERDLMQNRVLELETDVKALQNSCKELRIKIGDYEAIEEKLMEKETELSALHGNLLMKEQEAEEPLMSASQLRSLFEKIDGIEISFANSEVGDMEPQSSVYVKKLFYIVDNVTELHNQINTLSRDKEKLQSVLSTQSLEIEHLKEETEVYTGSRQEFEKMKNDMSELMFGLEKLVDKMGGKGFVVEQTSSVGQKLLPTLEKWVVALLSEVENSKSKAQEVGTKLLGSQKVIDELSSKIKLLEDSVQSRTAQPEIVQERSIFEEPTLPTDSEISEVEDVGSVGKNGISSAASAAHARTMRKGSTEHLALNIDLETGSLINHEETNEDKGHVFKSLNTSGLIPKQGKTIADRIDGIWVSGGRNLMSRPRARLGVMAYCVLLHLWLLGTILL